VPAYVDGLLRAWYSGIVEIAHQDRQQGEL
jgi:hypothetical protein